MYKVFIKNLEGFRELFQNDERLQLAEPFYLLCDLLSFNSQKNANTIQYQTLYLLIEKAKDLKCDAKYHSFGILLTELDLQYFEFNKPEFITIDINPSLFEYQLSLLHQFTFPSYYN